MANFNSDTLRVLLNVNPKSKLCVVDVTTGQQVQIFQQRKDGDTIYLFIALDDKNLCPYQDQKEPSELTE